MTCADLSTWLSRHFGKGDYHAAAIYKAVMQRGETDYAGDPAFAKSGDLARRIAAKLEIPELPVVETAAEDDATKFVTELHDGGRIESVILTMERHETLCVSTQLGCRMGCAFCETGKLGLSRNLTTAEIVAQVWMARFRLARPIKNVVYMGMGEPFDNFDNVIRATKVLADQRGLDIAFSHQTVSTVGLVSGIERLAKSGLASLHLAISLNASCNAQRDRLMPVNRKWNMEALRQAILDYPLPSRGVVLCAYIVLPGENDTEEDAARLAEWAKGLPVRINIIPFNPGTDSPWRAPTDETMHRFSRWLTERGVFVRKRWSKGRDLMAGCGQLGASARAGCETKEREDR